MKSKPWKHDRVLLALGSVCVAVAISMNSCSTPEVEDGPPPNIIVVLSDDAGYADFGCYGAEQFRTPHIDSISEAGVRFTSGYVSASVCSPSRAGLVTGRFQQRFGHEFNLAESGIGFADQ